MSAMRAARRPAIAAAFCAIVLIAAAGHRMYRLSESDSGREIAIAPGDLVEISLPENPSTGYRWSVKTGAEPILGLEGERYERKASMPGAGGVHHWSFKALAAGSTTLELVYLRPWEKGVAPARTFTIKVRAGASAA